MKPSARIVAPVLLALLLAGGFLVFLWWQVSESTALLSFESLIKRNADDVIELATAPIDPRDQSLLHLRQGDIFAIRGEWQAAEEEYEKSVKADGGLPALRKLVQAQLQRRNIKGVRNTLRKMKQEGARPDDILLIESIVELRAGELLKAQSILEGATDSPQKHYGLALLGVVQGDHTKAQEHLVTVINGWEPVLRSYGRALQAAYDEFALFPEGSNVHLITLLARALAQVQECELALPLLTQVTNATENYRDAWIVQGYCELSTERAEAALLSLEHAYNIDPQKPEIQFFLARAYRALQQHDNAITFFEYSLINGFTPEDEVRHLIAEEALAAGKTELALSQYDALTALPNATIETFEGSIVANMTLQNTEEAYVKAVLATEKWGQHVRSYELLGWTASATDRIAEAKAAYEKALIIDPTNEEVRKKLEEITK